MESSARNQANISRLPLSVDAHSHHDTRVDSSRRYPWPSCRSLTQRNRVRLCDADQTQGSLPSPISHARFNWGRYPCLPWLFEKVLMPGPVSKDSKEICTRIVCTAIDRCPRTEPELFARASSIRHRNAWLQWNCSQRWSNARRLIFEKGRFGKRKPPLCC